MVRAREVRNPRRVLTKSKQKPKSNARKTKRKKIGIAQEVVGSIK
jgi:hypothetical protein